MAKNQELIQGISAYHDKLFELLKKWIRDEKNDKRRFLLLDLLNPTLTLEEARTILQVCSTTARRWTNEGKLGCFRTKGGQRRFLLSHVLECLEEMEKKGKGGKNG